MYVQNTNFGYNHSMRSNHHEGKHNYVDHVHQFLEVVCVMEGSVDITLNGVTQKADKGSLAVILPFHNHSYHTPEYCKIWVGVISLDWIEDFISGETLLRNKTAVFTPSPALFSYVLENLPPPHVMLNYDTMSREKYRSTKALFYAILNEYFTKSEFTSTVLHLNALSAVYMYVYQHYTEPITLKNVATTLGFTQTYLSHCISAIPNMSFRAMVNTARIERAKRVLTSTDKKIIDIAFDCGFASESIFYTNFVKYTGVTPREYRLSTRGNDKQKYATLLP